MQAGSGAKNPPWARSNVNTNMSGMNPQIMDPNSMMGQQGMMPFQQSQAVFNPNMMQAQGGMGMPIGGQISQGQMYPGNVVAYPTPRSMNPGMYQNAQNNQPQNNTDQRVFTGTVTKTHNDFGFVDHDVFYQTSVCAKGVFPKVNDRVLVEATYNPNMPFKWNATRVQVLPKAGPNQKQNPQKSNVYNAVPPPSNANKKPLPPRVREDRPVRREERKRSRSRSGSRPRDRRDSRSGTRRDSPPRKRPVVHQPSPVKYVVRVPRMPLDIQNLDVPGLSQRYTNLYVPSDFFNAQVKWGETFPPQMPFSINNPCAYHIMNKEAENPVPNDAVLEPSDADYRFSAKVMLISMPTLEFLYQKCGISKQDEKDKEKDKSRSSKSPLHPTRLIKFLVGQKGKGGENFAIGGPWSPSLDGEHPESDPGVLVKTAIRTCKALTGIDLSSCTQWYRVVEFYYWRSSSGDGGRGRLEAVVLFLPDAWSCGPTRGAWQMTLNAYKMAGESKAAALGASPAVSGDDSLIESQKENNESLENTTITIDENDDDEEDKPEATHYSKIDLRTMKVDQLRIELRARNANNKGPRSQLVSRLSKLIKAEEGSESKSDDVMELDDDAEQEQNTSKNETEENKEPTEKVVETVEIKDDKPDDKEVKEEKVEEKKSEKELEEEKRKLEKERAAIKQRYELPSSPHIIVHPNPQAKSGKFNCSVATLSLLLDYRITDNKEHSFELFVFAELFNEMLMRDFGFYIYKTLYTLPEKTEEVKEKDKSVEKDKKEEKKPDAEKKEEKKDDKKDDSKAKTEEKKDDKRDSRKRDRKESGSEDERSVSTTRRRGAGVDIPHDPYLLLSLVYFDTTRAGYINKKDLSNLFMSLGLQLSRSQIRVVLEKVCVKDAFSYKSLVQAIKDLSSGNPDVIQDLPLDTAVEEPEPCQVNELEETIATGNRKLLPIFNRPTSQADSGETKDVSDTGLVLYMSRVVDVGAMVASAARGATVRAKLEEALEASRRALKTARTAASSAQVGEKSALSQLSDLNNSLAAAKARITSLTASSKIFHSALKSIQSKVDAVVNIKYEDDDVVEVVNGPSKVEKEGKNVEEVKKESVNKTEIKPEAKAEVKSYETKPSKEEATVSDNMEIVDDKD